MGRLPVQDNDATAAAPASVPVAVRLTNSGTHAPASVRLSGLPDDVTVTPSAGWSCVTGLGLECTGPEVARGATAELVLTVADTTPVVDHAWLGTVTVTGRPGSVTSFPLAVASAPARYAIDVEQLNTSPSSSLDTWITVTNTGRTTGEQVGVELALPTGLNSPDRSWPQCSDNARGRCRPIGTLLPGQSQRLHIAFAGGPGDHPLTVTAADARGVTAQVSHDIQIGVEPAVVGVTAASELVLPQRTPTPVTVTVTNTGGSAATGVQVQANLPAGVAFVPGPGCTGPGGANKTVACNVGTLAAGESRAVTFQVRTEGTGADGRPIRVVALWDVPGSDQDARSDEAVMTVRVGPALPDVQLSLEPETTFVPGIARDVVATVTNVGAGPATGLSASFRLPAETYWERTAAGSVWSCTPSGAGATVTCTTASLAAGETVELAGGIRASGAIAGRAISLGLTWSGGSAVAQTAVVMGTLPACAPEWQQYAYYRKGDRVSFESWNYTRLIDFTGIYEPGRYEQYWQSEGACA